MTTRALRAAAALAVVALVTGCAAVPLPKTLAEHGQEPRRQHWDVKNCEAEAGDQTGYSPSHSPLLNWFQRFFFWGTSGAATGLGVMTVAAGAGASVGGSSFAASPIGDAMIAGAGAGAITGTVLSWSGQTRFERAWVACMEAHGYTIVRPEGHTETPATPEP